MAENFKRDEENSIDGYRIEVEIEKNGGWGKEKKIFWVETCTKMWKFENWVRGGDADLEVID